MTMIVKYLDLQRQYQDKELFAKLKEQFDLCQFVMGPEAGKFEVKFAKLCKTPYALGLNSGTDALFLAFKALNIGPGDEVITVPNSFVATAGAIIAAGARPVFIDVTADYNIDVDLIESAVTERTKAVLPVHLTGNPADMDAIMGTARRHGLFVIEDAAQAVLASINGQRVGSFGDAGCFSLHPLKNLNVCGDGGAITTKSPDIYEKVRLLRNHGLKNRDEIDCFGYNSRLDSIQALIANHWMDKLEDITRKRAYNAKLYDDGLKDLSEHVIIPPRKENVRQVYHTYVVQVNDRERLIDHLLKMGIETKIHYPVPIHLQKPCRELGYKKGDFPVCEDQSVKILSLPVHQHLTEEQIYYVIDAIVKYYSDQAPS